MLGRFYMKPENPHKHTREWDSGIGLRLPWHDTSIAYVAAAWGWPEGNLSNPSQQGGLGQGADTWAKLEKQKTQCWGIAEDCRSALWIRQIMTHLHKSHTALLFQPCSMIQSIGFLAVFRPLHYGCVVWYSSLSCWLSAFFSWWRFGYFSRIL